MIKRVVLLLLLASAGYAEDTPNVGGIPHLSGTDDGESSSKEDLILQLLRQIKGDVTDLKADMTVVKTDISELKGTTNSLETAVGGLDIKVSNLEIRANGLLI